MSTVRMSVQKCQCEACGREVAVPLDAEMAPGAVIEAIERACAEHKANCAFALQLEATTSLLEAVEAPAHG